MLSKRIIPCLDVREGRRQGIKFEENIDIGDPVEMARFYLRKGPTRSSFTTSRRRATGEDIMIDVVRRVAREIALLSAAESGRLKTCGPSLAGAEVSVNSAAVLNTDHRRRGLRFSEDSASSSGWTMKKVAPSAMIPSGYEVVIDQAGLAWA